MLVTSSGFLFWLRIGDGVGDRVRLGRCLRQKLVAALRNWFWVSLLSLCLFDLYVAVRPWLKSLPLITSFSSRIYTVYSGPLCLPFFYDFLLSTVLVSAHQYTLFITHKWKITKKYFLWKGVPILQQDQGSTGRPLNSIVPNHINFTVNIIIVTIKWSSALKWWLR